jgi:hypothetical protein
LGQKVTPNSRLYQDKKWNLGNQGMAEVYVRIHTFKTTLLVGQAEAMQ